MTDIKMAASAIQLSIVKWTAQGQS